MDRQCTLEEASGIQSVRGLSENQRKIISLVGCGLCQADIARKLKVSRAYVNQIIKRLETHNLIQRIDTHKQQPGRRQYTLFYELSPELQQRVKGEGTAEPFTEWRTHHIRRKFKVISQSGPPTKDKRTHYSKSWFMRGGERSKYWFVGKAGLPSITLDIHPKTIVAYMDRGQKIIAHSKEEAQEMALLAIFQGVQKFIEEQAKFGIQFETDHVGEAIGKAHVGMAFHEGGPLDSEINIPGMWVDKSVEKELGPGFKEVECHIDHKLATPLERAVMSVATIEDKLPEMFRGMIDPLNQNVLSVMAQLQGGRPVEAMFQQAVGLLAQMMEKMNKMDDEIRALKGEK